MIVDETAMIRRIENIERSIKELGPSVAQSFQSTVSQLTSYASTGSSELGFNVGVAATYVGSGSIDIPAGFTSATVFAVVNASAYNGSTAAQYFNVSAVIDGIAGGEAVSSAASPGYVVGSAASAIRSMGVSAGGVINISAKVRAGSEWGANATNIVNIDAIAMFKR